VNGLLVMVWVLSSAARPVVLSGVEEHRVVALDLNTF